MREDQSHKPTDSLPHSGPDGDDSATVELLADRLAATESELAARQVELDQIKGTVSWRLANRVRRLLPAESRRGRFARSAVRRALRRPPAAASRPPEPTPGAGAARPTHRGREEPQDPVRVLLICGMPVTDRLAGPAIRSWWFAKTLSKHCEVTLLVPNEDHPVASGFAIKVHLDNAGFVREAARQHDVVIFQGWALEVFPGLAAEAKFLVVDLIDPFNLEDFHSHRIRPLHERMKLNDFEIKVLNEQLRTGDFFICGNERQRDYWLGMLNANRRINPMNSDDDPTFRRLIDIVPFGIADSPPQHTRRVLKGVDPRVAVNDKVVLWMGGVWEWLDPLTPVRAMAKVAAVRQDVKLMFPAVTSPDPGVPAMPVLEQAIELSRELGLYDRQVIFHDWIPYDDLANYLLEADLGISCHKEHLETRYSIRTRLFDYIWAGLPMVLSEGDSLSEELGQAQVAEVVPMGDSNAFAESILRLLEVPDLRSCYGERFDALRHQFSWDRVAEPLVRYCRQPRKAPDYLLASPSR